MWTQRLFFLFLFVASWQDYQTKHISSRLLWSGGVAGSFLCAVEKRSLEEIIASCCVGMVLLFLSRGTGGAVGEGDGLFFVVSGLYLSWRKNVQLLVWGMIFCFVWSLPMAAMSVWAHGQGRKQTLPFLPFLLPAAIWMGVMGT